VIVEGKKYDLTQWKNYHPGGHFILHQYDDKDATDVFAAFHGPEAYERLKKLKGVPVDVTVDPKIAAFRQFRQKLIADGWFQWSIPYSVYKFTTTCALVILGSYLAIKGYWMIGAGLVGLGFQQLGWLGHDLCHHNFTPYRRLNNFLAYIAGNLLGGFSVNWWKNRHNTHHAITNVMESDPDIDNLPLFVWEESDLVRVPESWLASSIVSYQEFYFVPWTSILKLIWEIQSYFFVVTTTIQNKSFLASLKYERATLALHWLWFVGVAWFTPTWTSFFFFMIIAEAVGGCGIALIVFMNHYALDHHEQKDRLNRNFLDLQLGGTRNIRPHPFMNWLSGGLNLQVEHHLFPTMPRNNLLAVRPLVQQFCKEQDIEYLELSYWDCLMEVEKKLHRVSTAYLERMKKVE